MLKTPVLFLIFNRPDVTSKVFESIRKAQPKKLYIAADGPRDEEEKVLCEETRKVVIESIDWDCEVKTLFREKNMGLRSAVTGALDWFFCNEEQGIILEDDCLAGESFFRFCEEMLDYYKNDSRIMHIAGSNYQDGNWRGNGSYYFSKLMHCWGWASWRRAWELNRRNFEGLADFKNKSLIKYIFEKSAYQRFWLNVFNEVNENKLSSWATIWCYSIFINSGMCIIPNSNLVANIGFGENATHTKDTNAFNRLDDIMELKEFKHPSFVVIDKNADEYTSDRYYSLKEEKPLIKQKSKGFLNKMFFKKKKKKIEIPQAPFEGLNFEIHKTAKFDKSKINFKPTSNLKIGEMSIIEGCITFDKENSSISVGDRTFIGNNTNIISYENIVIGNDVLISWGCTIIDTNSHSIHWEERKNDVIDWYNSKKDWTNVEINPIKICDKTWIGFNSIILKGITIGEGAVIGCGSVVTKDVEPYTVVAGNPAKFIKRIDKIEV